jgi:hypothetical protein
MGECDVGGWGDALGWDIATLGLEEEEDGSTREFRYP